ncbi:hypothetical protein [Geodermatophilus sp. SYSU D00815]
MADAATTAAREVARVRGDPTGRYALAADFYRSAGGARRRYAAAELGFLRWELARGVLAPADARPPGSPWWRAVNERLLRDKVEADLLAAGAPGGASAASVELWELFLRDPRPAAWYRAHNASIVGAYLEHEELTAAELPAERFLMNVALLRVLYTHALVARPRLALGPLARLGPVLADPRGPTVRLFLDLRRSFPSHYPVTLPLAEVIAREQPLARALDYGVIAPRLPDVYAFSAAALGEPRVVGMLDDGAPAYAWPHADREVWTTGNTGRHLALVAGLTGAREAFDRQFDRQADRQSDRPRPGRLTRRRRTAPTPPAHPSEPGRRAR